MWLIIMLILTQTLISIPDHATIGPRFHHETGYDENGAKGENHSWGAPTPTVKEYPHRLAVRLPGPAGTEMTLEDAVHNRQSVRNFRAEPIPLTGLSRLLNSACGVTKSWGSRTHRSVPSAGGLNPIELYLIVSAVDSLTPGLYHFRPSDSALELLAEGDFADSLHAAANRQTCAQSPPVAIAIAARFERTTAKYADRGYRYVYMESGAVCQNVYLQATALGLGTVAVGAFNDDALNKLLGLDGASEAALILMPVGFPASE